MSVNLDARPRVTRRSFLLSGAVMCFASDATARGGRGRGGRGRGGGGYSGGGNRGSGGLGVLVMLLGGAAIVAVVRLVGWFKEIPKRRAEALWRQASAEASARRGPIKSRKQMEQEIFAEWKRRADTPPRSS